MWQRDGGRQRIHTALREQARQHNSRHPQPSASILDSHSVNKRYIWVETQGLLLRATVHTADVQDCARVPLILKNADRKFPRMAQIWVGRGYTGTAKTWKEDQLG